MIGGGSRRVQRHAEPAQQAGEGVGHQQVAVFDAPFQTVDKDGPQQAEQDLGFAIEGDMPEVPAQVRVDGLRFGRVDDADAGDLGQSGA